MSAPSDITSTADPAARARNLQAETAALFERVISMKGGVIVPLGGKHPGGLPFYCVHPVAGVVAELHPLANQIGPGVQFYGIGVPLKRLTEEHGKLTVEERAQYYVNELVKFQPAGPIALGGWSAGVIVALEMAQQLRELGREDVLLVGLDLAPEIDAGMSYSRYALKLALNVPRWIKSEKLTEREARRLLSKQALKKANRLMSKILGITRSPLLDGRGSLDLSEPHKRFIETFFEELEKYQPKPYDGRVLAIVAGTEPLFHLELVKEKWAKIASHLEVVCVKEATHRTIMTMPHVAQAAKHLQEWLESISAERKIYDAPTIATLGGVLQQESTAPVSPLVLLKPGTDAPPIFITHGLGGNVMELTELAKHMRTNHPIYGIQARGLDEVETPHDRIEDMAQYYLDFIRRIQPKGPYFLIGLSVGGLIQLEIAQRLSESGEEIGLLALLDTWPHPRLWPFRSWLGVLARRVKHHAAAIMQLGFSEAVHYLIHISRGLVDQIRVRRGASRQQKPPAEVILPPSLQSLYTVIPPALQWVRDSSFAAWTRYRPGYYRGKITYLRAGILGGFPDDPALYWGKLTQEFEVHTLPCDHVGMIGAHAESVAVQLVSCLEEAVGKK
jgi:thioesterase domain-containing protein